MNKRFFSTRGTLWTTAASTLAAAAIIGLGVPGKPAEAGPAPAAPAAIPVTVATVAEHQIKLWAEFSGRLEAVERVDVRSRVAGAVQAVHFREGAPRRASC